LSKTAAERQALKRQGIKSYRVHIHAATVLPMLVAEGFLLEGDMGDETAVGVAIAAALSKRGPRILRDQTAKPIEQQRKRQNYKPKRQETPRHDRGRVLSLRSSAPPDPSEPRRSGVNGRNVGVL
jgi:ADP-ribosylglycohydrolase